MSDEQQTTLTQEIATIAPEMLEQKMVEREQAEIVDANGIGNPEDLAAAFFKQNYPVVRALLSQLSKRAIERAVICAAAYPLVPKGYKPQSKEESKLAWALEQMIACKALMIEAVKLQKLESVDQLKEETNSLTKGEIINGTEEKQID